MSPHTANIRKVRRRKKTISNLPYEESGESNNCEALECGSLLPLLMPLASQWLINHGNKRLR
jgi:hypothetical protein